MKKSATLQGMTLLLPRLCISSAAFCQGCAYLMRPSAKAVHHKQALAKGFVVQAGLLQDDKRREKEVEQMRASLDQMRAANQERRQQQQSAETTLLALKVPCLAPCYAVLCHVHQQHEFMILGCTHFCAL